jgi:hypothetical protein
LGFAFAGAAVIGGTVAVVSACAENNQTIFIRAVQAKSTSGDCVVPADPERARVSSGIIDLALASSYSATILVGNQMIPRGDPVNVRAESSRVILKGAVVRVMRADGTEIRAYTRLAQGFVEPAGGNTPGYGNIAVDIIDAESAAGIGAGLQKGQAIRLLARLKVFGTTLGGKDVETGEFEFPVDVCLGCLVRFTPDPTTNECCTGTTQGTQSTTECAPGQDTPSDCSNCRVIGGPGCEVPPPPRCGRADGGVTPVPDAGTD